MFHVCVCVCVAEAPYDYQGEPRKFFLNVEVRITECLTSGWGGVGSVSVFYNDQK